MQDDIHPPDVLIVGGGVIGCAIAYYAAMAGFRVIVADEHTRRPQASLVAAGLVAPSPQLTHPSPFAALALASAKALPQVRDELLLHSGIDIQLEICGTLRLATSERQAATQQKRLPKQQRLGLNLTWLTAAEACHLEPALAADVIGAVYGPQEGQVNAKRMVQAYRTGAERHGAVFRTANVLKLITSGNRVLGVETERARIPAGHVVLATGAWAPGAEHWLGFPVPITPERGQLAVVSNPPPALAHIVFGEQIYLAPKHRQGTVVIGASKDQCGYTTKTTVAAITDLLQRGMRISPALAHASVRATKAGLRPRTPDGCPIIGPIPGWAGVSLAVGHGSNGLLLSSQTGQIMVAQLSGRTPPLPTEPYGPQRFAPSAA